MPDVLVVVKGLGLGGAERLVAEGIAHAAEHGSRYRYEAAYVLPWKDQLTTRIERAGVAATCVGGPEGSIIVAAKRIRSMSRQFDIVHAHLPATGIISRLVATTPVVYTEHNIASSYRRATRFANRTTYRWNTAVTAVSDAVHESLIGYPGPPAVTIRNGVAVDEVRNARTSVREEFGIGEHEQMVVHVGNIRPYKGHLNLIHAVAALSESHPEIVVLSAGTEKQPGDLGRLEALARTLGLADRIRFLGRREDAHRLISAADVLVNPSDVEGLPVVILEAMKLGTPIIATDVGGVSSVIRNGQTGWLVPPNDPTALADAVNAALTDPAEGARRAAEAMALVESEYGIERMVTEFEGLYDRILQ